MGGKHLQEKAIFAKSALIHLKKLDCYRIMICMMCADPYPMDIILKPFMKDSSFIVVSDPETSSLSEGEDNMFTIDTTINAVKQKIEVTAVSYHGAQALLNRGEIFQGYILAYCPKRKSSIITMK